MILADKWKDYEIIQTGNGDKLERWGDVILLRPDPQVIWKTEISKSSKADAIYKRSSSGGGKWNFKK